MFEGKNSEVNPTDDDQKASQGNSRRLAGG